MVAQQRLGDALRSGSQTLWQSLGFSQCHFSIWKKAIGDEKRRKTSLYIHMILCRHIWFWWTFFDLAHNVKVHLQYSLSVLFLCKVDIIVEFFICCRKKQVRWKKNYCFCPIPMYPHWYSIILHNFSLFNINSCVPPLIKCNNVYFFNIFPSFLCTPTDIFYFNFCVCVQLVVQVSRSNWCGTRGWSQLR